jgi:hypothetical protein
VPHLAPQSRDFFAVTMRSGSQICPSGAMPSMRSALALATRGVFLLINPCFWIASLRSQWRNTGFIDSLAPMVAHANETVLKNPEFVPPGDGTPPGRRLNADSALKDFPESTRYGVASAEICV